MTDSEQQVLPYVARTLRPVSAFVVRFIRARHLGGVAKTLLTNALITAMTMGSGVLVARLLHPEGRGALAKIQLYPGMLAAAGIWGLHQTIARRAAREKDASDRGPTLGVALASALVLALVSIALYATIVPFLPYGSNRLMLIALVWGILWLPVNYVSRALLGIDHGSRRWTRFNLTRVVLYPTYIAILLVLAVAGYASVLTVAAALLTANAAVALVRLIVSWRDVAPSWPGRKDIVDQLKQGTAYAAANVSAALTTRVDRLLAVMLFPSASVGLYVVAGSLAALHAPLSHAFALNAFAEAANREDMAPKPSNMIWAVLGVLGVCVLAGALGPFLLPLVYGRDFSDAVALVPVLCAGGFFVGLANIYEEHYRGAGLPRWSTIGRWLCALVAAAVCLLYRDELGIMSIAYGFTFGHCARFLWFVAVSLAGPKLTPRTEAP